jgi:hypothetical protein
LLKNINQRKIPSLFVRLCEPLNGNDLQSLLDEVLNPFTKAGEQGATCLSPVKQFLMEAYNTDLHNIDFLYQLLPHLQSLGLIDSVSPLHLNTLDYKLPRYTADELQAEISKTQSEIRKIVLR